MNNTNYLTYVTEELAKMDFHIPSEPFEQEELQFCVDTKSHQTVRLIGERFIDLSLLHSYTNKLFQEYEENADRLKMFACKIKLSWNQVVWVQANTLGVLLTVEMSNSTIVPKARFIKWDRIEKSNNTIDIEQLNKLRMINV